MNQEFMNDRNHCFIPGFMLAVALFGSGVAIAAEGERWRLQDVTRMALKQRPEITAAHARVEAARWRPTIVSALEDPMLSPSVDHYPFKSMDTEASMEEEPPVEGELMEDAPTQTVDDTNSRRYDWSISVEQRFPFSRVLTHRRHAAEADAAKASAEADRTALDVELDAAAAFFMLHEKRRMATVVTQQLALARQFVSAAGARYSAGTGNQPEVLRVEVEVARLEASLRALQAEIRGAETMLNTSLSRAPGAPVPELVGRPLRDTPLPSREDVRTAALLKRPELHIGSAEITRASADVKAMQSMYAPMGMVRLGYSSTMAEGRGAMLMVGVSLPVWREKLHSGVAEARAMERMAYADLDAMKRMVEGEAVAARDQLEAAQIQYLSLRDEVVPRAQRLITPTLSSYASGQGNLLTVIEAAQALWAVQGEVVMAETALGMAWARLNRMTGIQE